MCWERGSEVAYAALRATRQSLEYLMQFESRTCAKCVELHACNSPGRLAVLQLAPPQGGLGPRVSMLGSNCACQSVAVCCLLHALSLVLLLRALSSTCCCCRRCCCECWLAQCCSHSVSALLVVPVAAAIRHEQQHNPTPRLLLHQE